MALLALSNVTFTYEGAETPALSDLTLSIDEGSFVAVVGRNGSGKSTLAKLLNALYIPQKGVVLVDSIPTSDEERVWDIRSNVGMVFQNPDNQLVATVVEEDVAFGPENLGVPTAEIRTRVDEALRTVGMQERALTAPHMLSGGQKQRVAVAGMLAMRPRVLVLDEATAMLDPMGRREVLSTVERLHHDAGMTVIWVTHFMEEALTADRLIVLHEGKLALDDTPRALFQEADRIRALGMDVPAMAALAEDLMASGIPLPKGILSEDEMLEALCPLL